MPFQKILVALDGSFQAPFVFEKALESAVPRVSTLTLIHTIRIDFNHQNFSSSEIRAISDQTNTFTALKQLQQQRIEHETQKAQVWLSSYQQQAIAEGITTEIDCQPGEPGIRICHLAATWGASLIVLGRRGYAGLRESALGSVSNYVIHHAPCSVLIAQGDLSAAKQVKP
jgi:nucleotide-binding universal stress UspA family protein